jgi:hypothetical protein
MKKSKRKEKSTREKKSFEAVKNFFLFTIVVTGLIIGLNALSFYTPKEDTLKIRPAPPLERVFEYNQKINSFGESCGRIDGNCKICLECVDGSGNKLTMQDFKDNTKTGTCEYIERGENDDIFCSSPLRRCDGNGNCIRCFKDEHCGDCSRCAVNFFNMPGQTDEGECVPLETKNREPCNADLYRDGFTGQGICYHGACAECIENSDCPEKLRCSEEKLCTA